MSEQSESKRSASGKRVLFARAVSLVTFSAASLVMFGWLLGVPLLTRIRSHWPVVSMLTAIALMASSVSLLFATGALTRDDLIQANRAWRLSRACAAVTVVLGLLALLVRMSGWSLILQ